MNLLETLKKRLKNLKTSLRLCAAVSPRTHRPCASRGSFAELSLALLATALIGVADAGHSRLSQESCEPRLAIVAVAAFQALHGG